MIELLLRKQTSTKKNNKKTEKENKEQEKIILSMDSENLGKITIVLTVMGFKVWCTVYSDNQDAVHHFNSFRNELSENLAKFQYTMEDFKTARKKLISKSLLLHRKIFLR